MLVFEIKHSCSNIFVFTITKKTIVMIVNINGLCLLKINVNFLISTLKSNEKGGRGNISII